MSRASGPARGLRVVAVLVLALAALIGAFALRSNPMPRGALWLVIRSCVLMQDRFGTPYPCLRVVPDTPDAPGFAVLRAPGNPTHVITTPIVPISGIESAAVLQPGASTYWRAALMSRQDVENGAAAAVPPGDVGLAINSRRTRSQDQLHIHAECLSPDLLDAARSQSFADGAGWQVLRRPVDNDSFVGRLVDRQDVEARNPFAILATLPSAPSGDGSGLGDVAALLVPTVADGAGDRFILLASRVRRRSIERLLDESCSVASHG